MKQTMKCALTIVLAATLVTGCTGKGKGQSDQVKAIGYSAQEELDTMQALELARENYRFRLEALKHRFTTVGDLQRESWADKELKNLLSVDRLVRKGVREVEAPQMESLAGADVAMLIELVVSARRTYLQAADKLLSMYQRSQDIENVRKVRSAREKFNPIMTYLYSLSAEIPGPQLRATVVRPEAERAFKYAMGNYEFGKRSVASLSQTGRQRRLAALKAFRQIVSKYPDSTKIGRCAFYIAELYRKYGEYDRAVVWYDRAWQWDPNIEEPARYEAARLYDHKLADRVAAVKYYRLAIETEGRHAAKIDIARDRLRTIAPKP
ncbi:MAG: hypothetical protein J7M14_02840 [Planctomycetes bacterium]|nr:hypothetical protein [Planctomycetota bacterium]